MKILFYFLILMLTCVLTWNTFSFCEKNVWFHYRENAFVLVLLKKKSRACDPI